MGGARHPITTVPEFRRNPVINHIANHMRAPAVLRARSNAGLLGARAAPAVLDQPKRISSELKIIAPLIDAV